MGHGILSPALQGKDPDRHRALLTHLQRIKGGRENKRQNDKGSFAVRKTFSSRCVFFKYCGIALDT